MAQDRNPLARIPVAQKIPEGVRFAAAAVRVHISALPELEVLTVAHHDEIAPQGDVDEVSVGVVAGTSPG